MDTSDGIGGDVFGTALAGGGAMPQDRIFLRAIAAALALLVPMTAAAQEHDREQPTTPQTRSYAYQTLVADAASLGTIIVGTAMKGDSGGAVTALGGVGYVFATPSIHGTHSYLGRAVGSFYMRLGAGALALLYYHISKPGLLGMDGDQDARKNEHGEIFGTLALLSIPVVVDLLRAKEEVGLPTSQSARSLTFAPSYDVGTSTVQLQLLGRM